MCTDTLVQLLLPWNLILVFSRFLVFKFGVFQILEICSDKTSSILEKSTYLVCTGTPRGPNTPGSLVEIEEAPLSNPTYLLRRALVSLFIVSLL